MLYKEVYQKVIDWIPEGVKVLDLGTGDGTFLKELIDKKKVIGEGVEINPNLVSQCIQKGLVVHQGDIMEGLDQYNNNSFDYIFLLGTFQELIQPDQILDEIFRVGKNLIIAYNNFAHWEIRFKLMFLGKTPITNSMPYPWYKTPNVQYFSIKDFDNYCISKNLKIVKQSYFYKYGEIHFIPNLFAEQALAHVIKNSN